MKILLLTSPKSMSSRYEFDGPFVIFTLSSFLLLSIALGILAFGLSDYWYDKSFNEPRLNNGIVTKWTASLEQDRAQLREIKEESELKLRALTSILGESEARLRRLEALGERLIESTELNDGEFDFTSPVAIGGVHDRDEIDAFAKPEFINAIDNLMDNLDRQRMQMQVLENVLNDRVIEEEIFIAGKPIKKGWMSSFYGKRIDPFSGKLAIHKGVDFAGKEGAEVIAVASGVVISSILKDDFGWLVELDHGNGYITRYAHNKRNVVELGDIVSRGQTLAYMGSTGRSTGPHVHFEVLRNGRHLNPEQFVYRKAP